VGHAFFHTIAVQQIFTCRSGTVHITPLSFNLQLPNPSFYFILIAIITVCTFGGGVSKTFSNTAITGGCHSTSKELTKTRLALTVLATGDRTLNTLQPATKLKKCTLKGRYSTAADLTL